jgi:flavin reductase (DIM6/NTAB) family NADH-FMN oxidoreductase RutF
MTAHVLDRNDNATSHRVAHFKHAAGRWASGVAIITTIDVAGRPFGLTMSSVASLSIDPLRYLICVDRNSNTLAPMLESRVFCVNFLGAEQGALAMRFARKSGDKFEGVTWSAAPNRCPIMTGAIACISCDICAVHDGGDHDIVVGSVVDVMTADGEPLLYYRGSLCDLRHRS